LVQRLINKGTEVGQVFGEKGHSALCRLGRLSSSRTKPPAHVGGLLAAIFGKRKPEGFPFVKLALARLERLFVGILIVLRSLFG
jgi:hypothetical protein